MNGHDFLHATATLIGKGWCCGADARDCHGKAVAPSDSTATAWSLLGALAFVSERAGRGALEDALWGISGVIPDWSLEDWNDAPGRSQAETMQMLASASSALAGQPPQGPAGR
jgi:hypothetical protein